MEQISYPSTSQKSIDYCVMYLSRAGTGMTGNSSRAGTFLDKRLKEKGDWKRRTVGPRLEFLYSTSSR